MADMLEPDSEKVPTSAGSMATSILNAQSNIVPTTTSLNLETPSASAGSEYVSTDTNDSPITLTKNFELEETDNPPTTMKSISIHTTVETLPNELLSNILGYLDSPPLSANLHDEPTFDLTAAGTADLKAFSRVSKRWREATLPLLFRHARFAVELLQLNLPIRSLEQEIQPFLEFVEKHGLMKFTTTFVIVAKDDMHTDVSKFSKPRLGILADFWRVLFKTIDPVDLLLIAHPIVLGAFTSCGVLNEDAWNFDSPCHYLRLRRPSALSKSSMINDEDVPPHSSQSPTLRVIKQPATSTPNPIDNIPDDLVKREAASTAYTGGPESPKAQTATVPRSSTAEPGDFSSAELKPADIGTDPEQRSLQPSTLFEMRPWSSILLNEGSFIKAYSTYEFWLRKAPSVCTSPSSTLQILTRSIDSI